MAALDLLGRRWALRILWELRDGPVGPRALCGRCDAMSASVLYQRLRELTTAGLVDRDDSGHYALTHIGRSLSAAIEPLDRWAATWAQTVRQAPVQDAPDRPSRLPPGLGHGGN